MNNRIRYRGPVSEGVVCDKQVSLGHVRLPIIDLSPAGSQPMTYKNNTIVFNGEVYNYIKLRRALKKRGYKFRTNTDTEVVLASYCEWGEDCVKRFNGMWAFCIYDKTKGKLILSRDRVGKKPLYYYFDGKKFIFSSEIKGILLHSIKKKLNLEAIDFYLTLGFIPSPMSIWHDIYKLEPRQTMMFDLKTKKLSKHFYYDIPKYEPNFKITELIDIGKELLKEATELRLRADVPVGAFLSGGLDSSAVVGEMAQQSKLIETFSVGFCSEKYDESKYAKIVSDKFKTKHHHLYFNRQDFPELLNPVIYYYDEPFGDYSCFPTMKLCKEAANKMTVALSGDGGDEIFGGYYMHRVAAQLSALKIIPRLMRQLCYKLVPKRKDLSLIGKLHEALRLSLVKPERFYAEIGDGFVYKPESFKKWSTEKLKQMLELSNGKLAEAVIKYDQFYNTLGDNFLVKTDRAASAYALEVRSPFLDYRFLYYSSTVPTAWKVTPFANKILMKHIIKDSVPFEIICRQKQGFTPPIADWIDSYKDKLFKALETLHKKKVIGKDWYVFYKKVLSSKSNTIYNNYKVRLFILWHWWLWWGKWR